MPAAIGAQNPAANFPDNRPLHPPINLSQSTVLAHLATLEQAGLLKMHRVGQWVFVSRDEQTIRLFVAALTEDLE